MDGVICPMCGKSDRTAKVSSIYLAGVEQKYRVRRSRALQDESQEPEALDFTDWEELGSSGPAGLVDRLEPPSGKRPPLVQPLHPDMMAVALALITPVFIYGMITSQPAMLWVIVPVLLAFYGWYFWKRKTLVAKFQSSLEQQKQADKLVRKGIDRWMKLYFCARDQVTFTAAGQDVTPLDQLSEYLRKE